MYSLISNMFNASKNQTDSFIHEHEHEDIQDIENKETTVLNTITQSNVESDETVQIEISKENSVSDDVSKSPGSIIHAEFNIQPRVILTDCSSEQNRFKERTDKSNECLNDGKRVQRKCAKVAAQRISQISWQLDETQARSLSFNRTQSKRLCAKVAASRISEIVKSSSPESDADDEIELEENDMSDSEMSKTE